MEGSRRVKAPTGPPERFAASRASIRKPLKYALFSEDTADKVTVNEKNESPSFNMNINDKKRSNSAPSGQFERCYTGQPRD